MTNLEGTRRAIELRGLACGAFCSADIVIDDPFRFPILRRAKWLPGKRVYFSVRDEKEGQFVFRERPLHLYRRRMLPVRVRRMKQKRDGRKVVI